MNSLNLKQITTAFAVERQILATELAQSIDDKETIAAGLLLCLSFVIGQTIDDVKIERLDRIYPAKRNQGLIDFQVICRRFPSDIQVSLGICVLPSSDLEIVSDACNKLLVYKDFGLDRLCLLRSADLMTDVYRLPICLPKLLSVDIGGHFVQLKSQDLFIILNILSVFRNKDKYELTNEMISQYLHKNKILIGNKLIKGILAIAQF